MAFSGKKYTESKTLYNQALEIRSGDKHAQDRLKELEVIFAGQAVDEKYNAIVAEADQLFNQNDYENAKAKYSEALQVKPKETYAEGKIAEINSILGGIARADEKYKLTIKKADELFQGGNFKESKAVYSEAAAMKPGEPYPKEMMDKADSKLVEQARLLAEKQASEQERLEAQARAQDEKYQAIVDEADRLVDQNELIAAVGRFRAALDVKPQEQYPIVRIEEIRGIITRQQESQKTYEEAITQADKDFKKEEFEAAKAGYNKARQAKPGETYPDEMIAKIDSTVETRARLAAEAASEEQARLAAIQREKDSLYNAALAKADGFFKGEDYENARTIYRSALEVKPEETYPQQQIDEIGTRLAELSASQKAYEDAVAQADKDFKKEDFEAAKAGYNKAKQAKPGETYPDEMLAKIDSTVETRARLAAEAEAAEQARLAAIQREKDSLYNAALAKADGFFNGEDFENARTAYRSALEVKPEETYPQQQIDKIGMRLAELSASQKAYEEAVAQADKDFKKEEFEAAKAGYNKAKQAKPGETYPDEMLAKIDSTVETRARLAAEAEAAEQARLAAIQREKDSLYNAALAKADGFFNGEDFENARTAYRSALEVKPEETYPQQQIDKIGMRLAELSASQKAYEDAVAQADKDFKKEEFEAAKAGYNKARQAKPGEIYPDEMLAKIDSTVETRARLAAEAAAAEQARLAAIQREKDSLYNAAVASADGFFNGEDFENARTAYRSALEVKPEETYPQQQIDKIGAKLTELAAAQKEQEVLERNYGNAIRTADKFFDEKNFTAAKNSYLKASGIKPGEEYPAQRLTEIEGILQQQKTDDDYRQVILAADGYFKTQSYSEAKQEYSKALVLKPGEEYPQSQVNKIDDLLTAEQQRITAEQEAARDMERRREEIQQKQDEAKEQQVIGDAELNNLYNDYIARADETFDGKKYNVSRAWYYKALDVKSQEAYPQQRIAEINRIVNSMLLSQRDRDYQKYVNLADSTLRENQLAVARGWYNQALNMKPDELYPKAQLNEITNRIAERMASQSGQQFDSHIEKAKAAFGSQNYNVARFWYKKALELRPNDADVKNSLKEIEEALR